MGEAREITTLGALMAFAMDLEHGVAELCALKAGAAGDPERSQLQGFAEAHGRRRRELQRMLREDLNEVTLEPIRGIHTQAYGVQGSVAGAEETLGAFYRDAADRARAQLMHLARAFRRMGLEAEAFAGAAPGGPRNL